MKYIPQSNVFQWQPYTITHNSLWWRRAASISIAIFHLFWKAKAWQRKFHLACIWRQKVETIHRGIVEYRWRWKWTTSLWTPLKQSHPIQLWMILTIQNRLWPFTIKIGLAVDCFVNFFELEANKFSIVVTFSHKKTLSVTLCSKFFNLN